MLTESNRMNCHLVMVDLIALPSMHGKRMVVWCTRYVNKDSPHSYVLSNLVASSIHSMALPSSINVHHENVIKQY